MEGKNNPSNGHCPTDAEFVTFLYNEMKAASRFEFQSHLVGCEECTEHFAALSEAHFAVYEWKRAEFADLQLPEISIPSLSPVEVSAVNGTRLSWLDRIRASISFSPIYASGVALSIGILTIAALVFWIAYGQSPANTDEKAVLNPVSEPEVNASPVSDGVSTLTGRTSSDIAGPKVSTKGTNDVRGEKINVVKVSAPQRSKVKTVTARNIDPDSRRGRSPRLSSFDDEQDRTLRLADLFAQIETEKEK